MAKTSKTAKTAERAEEILAPIAASCGVRVYDVEYVREGGDCFLRCYIDKDGGVTIEDCEAVSRLLSDALDAADFIPEAYTLEVSSPGLGRTLTKDRHFVQSIGEEVEGTLFRPMAEKGPKAFSGILRSFTADTVTLEEEDGSEIVLERKNIAKIRLAIDF